MISQVIDSFRQAFTKLIEQPKYLLILRLTLLLVLLHGPDEFTLSRLPEKIFSALMLFIPNLLIQRFMWLALCTVLIINNIRFWFLYVNHEYLITYWCLVCLLAIYSSKPEQIMMWNAKLLLGLCFFLSTVWKFISGEYLDGSFLHATFLLDKRLEMGASLLGGLDSEVLTTNRQAFASMQANGVINEEVKLITSPLMSYLSLVFSYWTLLIEGVISMAFLSSIPKWLGKNRDWLLILFIVTTYPLIPVYSFAAMLCILGLAQCSMNEQKQFNTYLMVCLLIPLWMPLPQAIFNLIS
ncbi:hypothetical protein [Calothrix rhizosoleniae]|uniref:hypothetical protein n=1 Tax=Calothrix rhizosoleniae TaxID=888997 RepID=UPI000B49C1A4|nr:hypothetical protein [Calothrix rhizosoleniae]